MFRKVVIGLFALAASVSSVAAAPIDARSFLDATRTISSSRIVNATVEQALAAVKDPKTLISLNPLVTSVEQDTTDPSLWHIKDKIVLLGPIQFPQEYTAKFSFLADGVDSDTNASGVHLTNKWRVASTPEGTLVTEEAILTTNVLLVSFVEGQVKTSHGALLDAMANLLGKQA